eukprot:gene12353-15531_t
MTVRLKDEPLTPKLGPAGAAAAGNVDRYMVHGQRAPKQWVSK